MTIEEHVGKLKGTKLVFVGDGRNNMANSLMIGSASIMGVDFVSWHHVNYIEQSLVDRAASLSTIMPRAHHYH